MQFGESRSKPRRVRVSGREEVGIVIQEGKNFGGAFGEYVYCAVVHFPETGEVAFYDMSKVETVDSD
ncbi:hypothetical protein [Saccharopolyspora sp. NPDC049357]|uniref:hypothetical protein n=1 Tax=Saccharopolyspora sp. NPDC049357 TaxID=3154507 RepID=UPI00341B2B55